MKNSDPKNAVPWCGISEESLLPLWLRMEREYTLRLRKWNLPVNVTVTLLRLHLHPDISEPAALAEFNCLPRQTMTFILDGLEDRKLAMRTPHLNDRRRKIIQLSPNGHKLAEAICQDLAEFEATALRALGTKERPALRQMIARYTDTLAAENAKIAKT